MKKSFLLIAFAIFSLSLTQAQEMTKTMSVVPGGLYKALTLPERQKITHLILTGSMDAQDFKTMRDAMPNLAIIDLSKVAIVSYSGDKGTENKKASYKEGTIPQNAFFNSKNGSGKRSIQTVILPTNLKAIGEQAFYACFNLNSVTIPASVISIGAEAYYNCKSLVDITVLSKTPITKLGKGVFFAVDPSTCILTVPFGSKDAYSSAKQWQDFFNVQEVAE